MADVAIPTTVTLRVPCQSGAAHAFLRPSECPVCAGSGWRAASPIEYIYCDNGHELELHSRTVIGPTIEGNKPDDVDADSLVWKCPYAECDQTVVLDVIEDGA